MTSQETYVGAHAFVLSINDVQKYAPKVVCRNLIEDYNSGSAMYITHCTAGDRVQVKSSYTQLGGHYVAGNFTSFSGFLILTDN